MTGQKVELQSYHLGIEIVIFVNLFLVTKKLQSYHLGIEIK